MISRNSLDALAEAILAHLAENPELVEALVAETGLMPADLRRLAAEPTTDFATALLDFICASDDRLVAFAAASGWSVASGSSEDSGSGTAPVRSTKTGSTS